MEKNIWLYKWDYRRYDFKKLNEEIKTKGKGIGINYGNLYDDKEKVIKVNTSTSLKENDEVFIMFYNIPKSSNQILLKLSNLHFIASKDEEFNYNVKKGEHFYEAYQNGKFQKVAHATKVEWVMDLKDGTRFTKEKLEISKANIKNRPSSQRISCSKLIEDLNNNLHSYDELKKEMSKINRCTLQNKKASNKHETFITKLNLPYIEVHHFIMKYILKNFKEKNKDNQRLIPRMEKLINHPCNLILLCPVCHRKIHQGLPEEVKSIIEEILDNNKKLNKLLNIVVKILNKKNERKITKNQLISEMYNINFEEQ